METEWLVAIDWRLHKDPNEVDGFNAFLGHWEAWKLNKARVAEPMKLTPINTNLRRQQSVTKPLFSPEGPIPREYQSNVFDPWHHPASSETSPPSAPHTGPNTPDYYASTTWAPYLAQPPPPYTRSYPIQHLLPPLTSQPPSYHHTPYSQITPTTYNYSGWTGHGSSCGCFTCAPHHDPYYMDRQYRVQPIAG